jgi:hypothetical protein
MKNMSTEAEIYGCFRGDKPFNSLSIIQTANIRHGNQSFANSKHPRNNHSYLTNLIVGNG